MVVRMRLARYGHRNLPFYRIVVANAKSPRNGRFIEKLGTYDPIPDNFGNKHIRLNTERVRYWLSVGVQPSTTMSRLLSKFDLYPAPPHRSTVNYDMSIFTRPPPPEHDQQPQLRARVGNAQGATVTTATTATTDTDADSSAGVTSAVPSAAQIAESSFVSSLRASSSSGVRRYIPSRADREGVSISEEALAIARVEAVRFGVKEPDEIEAYARAYATTTPTTSTVPHIPITEHNQFDIDIHGDNKEQAENMAENDVQSTLDVTDDAATATSASTPSTPTSKSPFTSTSSPASSSNAFSPSKRQYHTAAFPAEYSATTSLTLSHRFAAASLLSSASSSSSSPSSSSSSSLHLLRMIQRWRI